MTTCSWLLARLVWAWPLLCMCNCFWEESNLSPGVLKELCSIYDWGCTYQCSYLMLDCLPLCRLLPWWSWPGLAPPYQWCWNCWLWNCVLLVVCAHGWERVVWGAPCTSSPGSLMFPLCTPHCRQCPHIGNCILSHSSCPWGLGPLASWGVVWL